MLEGKNGETCWLSQPKIPNQIKTKTTIKNGETCVIPTHRNGCKNSEKILWMTEFLNTEDSHASSSHESSSESTSARSADLGKHSVFSHFPKDRNCEICQRTKITRAPCRRRIGGAVPRAENFGDLITADHKVLSEGCELETVIDLQSWGTTWPPNGSSRIRAKQKLLRKRKGACKSSWSRIRSLKSFTLTVPWNLAQLVKIFPGIIVRRHHTDRKQMGLLREQHAEWKKVHLEYCCNQVWMKIGGQIPWECFTYLRNMQDLLSDEKTPYERRFGEPFKGPIIPFGSLVEYYPISAKYQSRIHQFGKEVLNLEGWRDGYRHWGVGNDGGIRNQKTQCNGSNISQRKWKINFSSRRWDESNFLEEIGKWEHPPWYGDHPIRGESQKDFLGESEGSLPPPPQDGCQGSDKWFLVHVRKFHIPPSRWTQSQTLLAERRIIPYSTEIHWRLQNYKNEFGCYAWTPHRWLLEYRWIKSFVWFLDRFHSVYSIGRETSRRIYVVRWETDKTAGDIQARSFMARTLDEIGKKCLAEGEA